MKPGLSGAAITLLPNAVLKTGDMAVLRPQAMLCSMLYPATPRVLAVLDNGYAMERLREPDVSEPSDVISLLKATIKVLTDQVWNHHAAGGHLWVSALEPQVKELFGEDAHMVMDMVVNMTHHTGAMIHGDPTLSNVMRRDSGEIVLVDPIWSHKVPSDPAVDLGKLLQSALGWEQRLFGWKYSIRDAVNAVTENLGPGLRVRAWLWCMLHYMRAIPYATTTGKPHIATFASHRSRTIFKVLLSSDGNRISDAVLAALPRRS